MIEDIRTSQGKLIGKLDRRRSVLGIKTGKKLLQIVIPVGGLSIFFKSDDGEKEPVFITSRN